MSVESWIEEHQRIAEAAWFPNWADDPAYLNTCDPDTVKAMLRVVRAAAAIVPDIEGSECSVVTDLIEALDALPKEPER